MREQSIDSVHQTGIVHSLLHGVNVGERNAIDLRFHMCMLVLVDSNGTRRRSQSPECSCPLEYVLHTGVRVGDFAKINVRTSRNGARTEFHVKYKVTYALDREQSNNDDVTQ